MRPSPFRHALAVLRTTVGLTQKEMAALAECSAPTIQAIELGKLNLSERLGGLIAVRTGIDLKWLMTNDVNAPPVTTYGLPYTKQTFEEARAITTQTIPPLFKRLQPVFSFRASVYRLAAILLRAHKEKKTQLCAYRIAKRLDELERDFAVTPDDQQILPKLVTVPKSTRKGSRNVQPHQPQLFEDFLHAVKTLSPYDPGDHEATLRYNFRLAPDGQMGPAPQTPAKDETPKTTRPKPAQRPAPRKR